MRPLSLHITFLLALVALTACRPTAPQRPSYRSGQGAATNQVDSALLGMLELNDRMREEADHQLAQIATEGMVREDGGFWIQGLHDIDEGLADGTEITLHTLIYDLDSTLLRDDKCNFHVGQEHLIPAIVEVLPMAHIGDSLTLLVPWYAGYGVTGTNGIPGYTNLRIEMNILNP